MTTATETPKAKKNGPLDLQALREQIDARIRDYVEAQVKGEPIDANELRRDLVSAGLGLADFDLIVTMAQKRYKAVEKIRRADSLQTEVVKLNARLEKLQTEISEVRKEYEAKLKTLQDAWQPVSDELQRISSEQHTLRNEAQDTLDRTGNIALREELKHVAREAQIVKIQCHKQDMLAVEQVKSNPEQQALETQRAKRAAEVAKPYHARIERMEKRIAELQELLADPVKGFSWRGVLQEIPQAAPRQRYAAPGQSSL